MAGSVPTATESTETGIDVDPGITQAQEHIAEWKATRNEHAAMAAFSTSTAALGRTNPSDPSYPDALNTAAHGLFSLYEVAGNFAALDGVLEVMGRLASLPSGGAYALPERITVQHEQWADTLVTRQVGEHDWTIVHPDGQLSRIRKDWSGWSGEGWPMGFTIERPDGSTFDVDESHFGDGWTLTEERPVAVVPSQSVTTTDTTSVPNGGSVQLSELDGPPTHADGTPGQR